MQLCISTEDYKIQYFKDLIFSVLFCLLPAITYLLAMERVLCAVLASIEHIILTTTDGSVCGTATGLLLSMSNYRFLLSLQLLTPISDTLQSLSVDIMRAQQQVRALTRELQRLRDDSMFAVASDRAAELVSKLDVDP